GRQFYKEHSDWPVIEQKYLDTMARLSETPAVPLEPLPGRLDRRHQDCPPGAEVVGRVPTGPVVTLESATRQQPAYAAPPMPRPAESGLSRRRPSGSVTGVQGRHRGSSHRGRPRGGTRSSA
ncbi:MAG: hypothetical protein AB7N65_09905, partial [Vicinamibacterales bacterium]